MDQSTYFILCTIGIAFLFDFINGFHDAANSIATIVTTGVLTPRQAVVWAAFFNFIAFLCFNLMVAKTIGSGLINEHSISTEILFAALVGGVFWNLVTWYCGLPSSSSHALIGGLAGAAFADGGLGALQVAGFVKVAIGIFMAPIVGILVGFIITYILTRLLRHKSEPSLNRTFKGFQLVSSALLSITHGGNDAQKTMGIIAILLFSASWITGDFYVPFWVVVSCQGVISLGTLFGGWRIVHTMGTSITHLNPLRGCSAEASAASIIFVATLYGIPVSTTQTVTGSIAGVGLVKGFGGTHWPVIKRIFLSWLLTIPAAGIAAGTITLLIP